MLTRVRRGGKVVWPFGRLAVWPFGWRRRPGAEDGIAVCRGTHQESKASALDGGDGRTARAGAPGTGRSALGAASGREAMPRGSRRLAALCATPSWPEAAPTGSTEWGRMPGRRGGVLPRVSGAPLPGCGRSGPAPTSAAGSPRRPFRSAGASSGGVRRNGWITVAAGSGLRLAG